MCVYLMFIVFYFTSINNSPMTEKKTHEGLASKPLSVSDSYVRCEMEKEGRTFQSDMIHNIHTFYIKYVRDSR